MASLASSTPSPPQSPSSPGLYSHDEALWAAFVHDAHMSCLPAVARREVLQFSSHSPTQARYIAQMASNSAFRFASSHDYFTARDLEADVASEAASFLFCDGGETCFDADVVKLVAHILNDRCDESNHVAVGWDVILAQLQQCHVTSSGTFWTSVSSSSAAQAMSPACR
jgi:hypothetical protein